MFESGESYAASTKKEPGTDGLSAEPYPGRSRTGISGNAQKPEKMRTIKSAILDYKEVVNSYVKIEDWRVKENSTVAYSVGGLILSNSGAVTANYRLSETMTMKSQKRTGKQISIYRT